MDSFLFFSGAAWAVYFCVAFLPFRFSLSQSGDRWFTATFLSLSFWALSGGFLFGGYATGMSGAASGRLPAVFPHVELWYVIGSTGIAGFLWANLHYTFRLSGVSVRPATAVLLLVPPVVAAFSPFLPVDFGCEPGFGTAVVDAGSGVFPFGIVFRVVQAIVLVIYTAVPAALFLREGKRAVSLVEKRTARFLAGTLILIPLLFVFVPACFEKKALPDPAAFFSIPYALMLIAGSARYRSLYLLPLRLGISMLHVLEVPAVILDRQGLVFEGNGPFSQVFGPNKGQHLREVAGGVVSSLAADVMSEASPRSGEQVAVTAGGVFRVTIHAVKSKGKRKHRNDTADGPAAGAAGLLVVFRPIERIESFREDNGLTARETEVAQLLAAGYSVKAASDALCVSETTIRTHRDHIYQKCAVRTRAELANLVARFAGAAHNAVDPGADGDTETDATGKTTT